MAQADTLNELDSSLVIKLPELESCSVYYLIHVQVTIPQLLKKKYWKCPLRGT